MKQSSLLLLLSSTTIMLFTNAFRALSRRRPTYSLRHDGVSMLLRASSVYNNTEELVPRKKMRKTQLRKDLKQYRIQQSEPLKKPPYTVFTNACLDEIYVRLPTTHEELLQVKGIGPKRLELHGDAILQIVAQYTNVDGGVRTISGSSTASIPKKTFIAKSSLTQEQSQAADLLLQKQCGFVTGSAGTGKSYLLKYLVQELRHQKVSVRVCAPTGVAAIHVGGSTLHSFFGIGLGTGSLSNLVKKVLGNKEVLQRIDETEVLIIDECSMLSSDLLETLDAVVRQVRRKGTSADLPFGGMKLMCFGDFFQLPPIAKGPVKPFCFDSPVWEELGLSSMMELRQVQRQDHLEFIEFLNRVRIGNVNQDDIRQLNNRCVVSERHPLPVDGIVPTRLYSLNRDVDEENESRLMELKGKEVVCRASNSWREAMPTETLAHVKKSMAVSLSKEMPDEVRLKVGAQVMLTRNKDLERNLVNGSRGVVLRFEPAKDGLGQVPVVRFDCGVVTSVTPVEAVRFNPDGGPGCLVRVQVPLKLAWALTVHKSQGTTLTRALLDISSAFEYGQCYVALSRVRSLEGLWLEKPARLYNIKVSPQVFEFYYKRNR